MFVAGINELVKVAGLAVCGFLLIDQFEAVVVELLEEFVPGDLAELGVVVVRGVWEAEPQDSGLVTRVRVLHLCGLGPACFCPLANFIMILRRL